MKNIILTGTLKKFLFDRRPDAKSYDMEIISQRKLIIFLSKNKSIQFESSFFFF